MTNQVTDQAGSQAVTEPPNKVPYATGAAQATYPGYVRPTYTPGLERTLSADQRPDWLYVAILIVALVTGIAANLLFSEARGIGFNLLIAFVLFFAGWYVIAARRSLPWWRLAAAVAAIFYSAALAVRASEILVTLNTLLVLGFTTLACTASYSHRLKSGWATAVDAMQVLFNVCLGWIILLAETPWRRLNPKAKSLGAASGVLTGILISVPFLLIFGFLFTRAEIRFQEFFGSIFSNLGSLIFGNFWITFWVALLSIGLLRNSFISASMTDEAANPIDRPGMKIGHVESATVLSLLNALFLIFVITQLPYLFGGQDRVAQTPDLPWSEYARRGFFELAWVAALLIPTLLLFFNCTRTTTTRQVRLIRVLGAVLSGLTAVVIASALQRMLLYTQTFGLTELRIYVSAFIVLLALIILLLNVFSFTGRPHLFIPSVLALGMVFSIGIQVPNVQAAIARDIVARQLSGKEGDKDYLRQLSTDAVPAILASRLTAEEKSGAVKAIISRHIGNNKPNLLDFPLSATRAYSLAQKAKALPN